MFISFANFYPSFIHRFNKIAALLISILNTSRNEIFSALQTSKIRVLPKKNNNVKNNMSTNDDSSVTIGRSGGAENLASRLGFVTFEAKITFAQLTKVFIKFLILHYFELD